MIIIEKYNGKRWIVVFVALVAFISLQSCIDPHKERAYNLYKKGATAFCNKGV